MLHLNIRSAKKNFNEFQSTMHIMKVEFQVIVLTETWLDTINDWNELPGYTAYHSIRSDRGGGGVTVLISSAIQSELVNELSFVNDLFEYCSVKFSINNKTYLVMGVYRAPASSSSCSLFNSLFSQVLETPIVAKCNTIFVGDLNIDICETPYPAITQDYINELRAAHFLPLITIPTRVTSHSATAIDHIWLNFTVPYTSGAIISSITDHYPIFAAIPNVYASASKLKIQFRDHSELNISEFLDKVGEFCNRFGDYECDDVNILCHQFSDQLYSLYNSCFPVKVKFISQKRLLAPWLTNALLKSIDRKHVLFRLSRVNNFHIDVYKNYRNVLCRTIAAAKRQYFTIKFEKCQKDVRATWRSINYILKPNSNKTQFPNLRVNGKMIKDAMEVAESFNDYFARIGNELNNQVPRSNIDPMSFVNRQCNSFVYFNTDPQEIISIVTSSKSTGGNLQTIPNFIYKKVIHLVAPIIAVLINTSVMKGVFPDVLKTTRVIPLFKSGKKDDQSNYRPISTLTFLSKIFEKVLNIRVYSFLNRYKILKQMQFGFQKSKSTCDAILHFTNCV